MSTHLENESDCPSEEYPSPCVVMVVRGWIFSHTRSLSLPLTRRRPLSLHHYFSGGHTALVRQWIDKMAAARHPRTRAGHRTHTSFRASCRVERTVICYSHAESTHTAALYNNNNNNNIVVVHYCTNRVKEAKKTEPCTVVLSFYSAPFRCPGDSTRRQ